VVKLVQDRMTVDERTQFLFEDQFFENYQVLVRLRMVYDVDAAFRMRARLAQILEMPDPAVIRGTIVQCRLEPSPLRRKWTSTFFNHVRAIESIMGARKNELVYGVRSRSLYHRQIGRLSTLNRQKVLMEPVEANIKLIGLSLEAIREAEEEQ